MIRIRWKTGSGMGLASAVVCGALMGNLLAGPQPPVAPTAPVQAAGKKAAATVNGEVIGFDQLEPVLKLAGPLPVALPEAQRRELHREALAVLIDDLLLQQYLRKYVPPANPADVDKKMQEMVEGLKKEGKTLKEFCEQSNQTETQLRANLANFLQWSSYSEKHIRDADLKRYWEGYRDFFDRVVVRASHIVLRVADNEPDTVKLAAQKKLLDLKAQIVAGKLEFAEAAKANSQCPSAPQGGDIGSFPRKFVVDEQFARAAFSLKVGEISDVVKTDFGLHLIKTTERKPGTPSDFEKIKTEVREFYLEDLRQTLLAKLRKEAKIEIHLP